MEKKETAMKFLYHTKKEKDLVLAPFSKASFEEGD